VDCLEKLKRLKAMVFISLSPKLIKQYSSPFVRSVYVLCDLLQVEFDTYIYMGIDLFEEV
jgi:hypothetical protein